MGVNDGPFVIINVTGPGQTHLACDDTGCAATYHGSDSKLTRRANVHDWAGTIGPVLGETVAGVRDFATVQFFMMTLEQ